MSANRSSRWPSARLLGILLLIPGMLRIPLPQADFHNIRHHDAPGENCPNHDHLLRWHPNADRDQDVAIVHWHWLLPQASGSQDPPLGESPDAPSPFRLSFQATLGDGLEPELPVLTELSTDLRDRSLHPADAGVPGACSPTLETTSSHHAPAMAGVISPPGILRAERLARLQHWNC